MVALQVVRWLRWLIRVRERSGKVISALYASTEETMIKMRTSVRAVLML